MSRRYCEEELELCREEVSELKARLDELQMDYAASDGARVRAEEALRRIADPEAEWRKKGNMTLPFEIARAALAAVPEEDK